MDGVPGGHDYFGADGKSIGWTTDSIFGGENIQLDTDFPADNDMPPWD